MAQTTERVLSAVPSITRLLLLLHCAIIYITSLDFFSFSAPKNLHCLAKRTPPYNQPLLCHFAALRPLSKPRSVAPLHRPICGFITALQRIQDRSRRPMTRSGRPRRPRCRSSRRTMGATGTSKRGARYATRARPRVILRDHIRCRITRAYELDKRATKKRRGKRDHIAASVTERQCQ